MTVRHFSFFRARASRARRRPPDVRAALCARASSRRRRPACARISRARPARPPSSLAVARHSNLAVTLTGCVHQLHIEVLDTESDEHSVESIVAVVGRTAQQAGKLFAKLMSTGPSGGAAK